MLKSEAEQIVRRAMEETEAEFTDEQIRCLGMALLKIAGRIVEEAMASYRPGVPGSRPSYYQD